MPLKKTISEKNGRAYYFENGRRVSDVYYKSHWGPNGRVKNKDFEAFWPRVPEGVNLEEARMMQDAYINERKVFSEMEQAQAEGLDVNNETPHFNLTLLMDKAMDEGKKVFVDGIEFNREEAYEYALTRMQDIERERNKQKTAYASISFIKTLRAYLFFTDKVTFF